MSLADLTTIEEVDAEAERRRAALAAASGRPAEVQAALLGRFMEAVAEYRRRIEAGASHPGAGVAQR